MTMQPNLPVDLLRLLQSVDTPTVCNAIEIAQGKRGFANFTRKTLLASRPTAPALVGFAATAQIAAKAPPTEAPGIIRQRRLDYYRAMAAAADAGPAVCVIEDLDDGEAIGAFWGEINTAIHKGFGLLGTVTNGLMRDLGDLADNYPVLAGGIGPSHGFVHVRSIGRPISVLGMNVAHGDLIHADRHGALVIPPDLIPSLQQAIQKLVSTEQLILGPARTPGFNIEAFEKAWAAFEQARI